MLPPLFWDLIYFKIVNFILLTADFLTNFLIIFDVLYI